MAGRVREGEGGLVGKGLLNQDSLNAGETHTQKQQGARGSAAWRRSTEPGQLDDVGGQPIDFSTYRMETDVDEF